MRTPSLIQAALDLLPYPLAFRLACRLALHRPGGPHAPLHRVDRGREPLSGNRRPRNRPAALPRP